MVLLDDVAAIDDDCLASQVARLRGAEEGDRRRDLVRCAGATDRRVPTRLELVLLRGCSGDPARRDGVDRYAVTSVLEGNRARQPVQGALGRDVRGRPG